MDKMWTLIAVNILLASDISKFSLPTRCEVVLMIKVTCRA